MTEDSKAASTTSAEGMRSDGRGPSQQRSATLREQSLALALVVVATAGWLHLMHLVGTETWGFGRITFWRLLGLIALVLVSSWVGRWVQLERWRSVLAVALGLCLAILLVRFGGSLGGELERPENRGWLIDVGANTYVAGGHLLEGSNPYANLSQLWAEVPVGRGVTRRDGQTLMFGVPYDYGYPYFPAMLLSYLPFRPLAEGYHSIRVANFAFVVITLLAMGVVGRRCSQSTLRWPVAFLSGGLFLGAGVLATELLRLGVTDVVIAMWAMLGYVALSYRRFGVAGVFFGVAQACKLLPGPAFVLPVVLHLGWGRQSRRLLVAYLATSVALVGPFVLADPGRFVSSTILFYATNHADGDDTSLWFLLSPALRPWFTLLGALSTLVVLSLAKFRRSLGLAWPMALTFSAYVVFIAFNKMTHLNYLWGVYGLGCCAFAILLLGQKPAPIAAG